MPFEFDVNEFTDEELEMLVEFAEAGSPIVEIIKAELMRRKEERKLLVA